MFQEETFRKNLKLIITIDDKIRDEELQNDINRKVAIISALSLGKIYKNKYLTGKETLPPNQSRVIEPAKFICSPLGKVFEKQTKRIENQVEKQVKAIEKYKKQVVESNALI